MDEVAKEFQRITNLPYRSWKRMSRAKRWLRDDNLVPSVPPVLQQPGLFQQQQMSP
jgi:hypothetical protein